MPNRILVWLGLTFANIVFLASIKMLPREHPARVYAEPTSQEIFPTVRSAAMISLEGTHITGRARRAALALVATSCVFAWDALPVL